MEDQELYKRAKKRVQDEKGFYVHVGVYLLVNLFLFLVNIITSPHSLWFYWVLLPWGIGVAANAFAVFGADRVLGPEWEERRMKEIMEKEKKD